MLRHRLAHLVQRLQRDVGDGSIRIAVLAFQYGENALQVVRNFGNIGDFHSARRALDVVRGTKYSIQNMLPLFPGYALFQHQQAICHGLYLLIQFDGEDLQQLEHKFLIHSQRHGYAPLN